MLPFLPHTLVYIYEPNNYFDASMYHFNVNLSELERERGSTRNVCNPEKKLLKHHKTEFFAHFFLSLCFHNFFYCKLIKFHHIFGDKLAKRKHKKEEKKMSVWLLAHKIRMTRVDFCTSFFLIKIAICVTVKVGIWL